MAANHLSFEKYTRFFVGGVYRHVLQEDLCEHFSKFGDVVSFDMKKDTAGNSRGYGWLLYSTPVPELTKKGPHVVKGSTLTVEVPHCSADNVGSEGKSISNNHNDTIGSNTTRREFVGRNGGDKFNAGSASYPVPPRRDSHVQRDGNARGRRSRSNTPDSDRMRRTYRPEEERRAEHRPTRYDYPQERPRPVELPVPVPPSQPITAPVASPPHVPSNTYAFIPISLCPPQYFADPRIFCARLDPDRIGSLTIVQQPHPEPLPLIGGYPATTTAQLPQHQSQHQPASQPPRAYPSYIPPHLTNSASGGPTKYNTAGVSTSSVPPPPGPPPSVPPPPGPPPMRA